VQTWYAIGVLVISMRYVVRVRTVGIHNFAGDDYITILVRLRLHSPDLLCYRFLRHEGERQQKKGENNNKKRREKKRRRERKRKKKAKETGGHNILILAKDTRVVHCQRRDCANHVPHGWKPRRPSRSDGFSDRRGCAHSHARLEARVCLLVHIPWVNM
jgi:hypothetical protein